ncbi:hypothetical protein FRC03_002447 [Tulasnella sp. 419]|nr:hypothetical protein FRC03_002447 [Tulasnella sp. 419]
MRRAAHDIIESMQLRWASDEVTEYTVLHQWTPPTGKQAVAAQRIDFTPDSTPVAVNPSMKFGSTQCKNGFSLSSLKFHEVGSTTLFVNARPGTDVESFTVVFELIYLVTTFYVGD